jgi:hypothetical protein
LDASQVHEVLGEIVDVVVVMNGLWLDVHMPCERTFNMNCSGLASTLDALAAIMAMQNNAVGWRPKTILAN